GVAGTLLACSTCPTGVIGRPVAACVAGNFGDKIGRKPMVVIALLGMAVFTFLFGCLASAGSTGLMAPVLLVTCRFIQGIACGAQWGGLALLYSVYAGPRP